QYRESDFNFVSRLMEREGIYYFFEHQNGKHILILADSPSAHDTFPGYDSFTYRPSAAKLEEQRETVTDWLVEKEIQPGMCVLNDFNFTTPKAPLTGNANISRQHQNADYEVFDYPGGFGTSDQGTAYAKLRIQELQAQYEILSAQATVRGVASGYKFALKGHPRSDQNRSYLITSASLRASAGAFEAGKLEEGEFFSCGFTAIPASEQFRPTRSTPRPLIRGPQTATVVGPSGQKIYTDPDGYGMVKVQFPWDRLGKSDENSSCWVRVSQAWAGKNWGDMALPHVGDEVIVECLEGDPDRPLITGRVYNANNMPPFQLPDNKEKRVMQDDYGNKLVFIATPGDEHIRLHSPHHNSGITLGRSSVGWTGSNDVGATLGDSLDFIAGAKSEVVAGVDTKSVLGAKTDFVIGTDLGARLGGKLDFTYGTDIGFNRGYVYEGAGTDVSRICEGNMVFGAYEVMNLIAGHGHSSGTAVFHAHHDHLEITVGGKLGKKEELDKKALVCNAILAVIPLLCGAGLAAASFFIAKSYEEGTDEDDATKQAASLKAEETAMGVAGGILALDILITLIYDQHLKKTANAITHLSHGAKGSTTPPPYHSRLKLGMTKQGNGESAILQANKTVELLADNDQSILKMDDKGVTLEHKTAKIVIQSGTSAITINPSGTIEIKGTKVNVTGLNVSSGALTVQDKPVAMSSTLTAEVQKLQAQDKEEATKREALTKALVAKRVLKSTDIK
ncbi:MAG: type VI secretion system Vgr family protein, partial [Limisphaerales bacterium]